MTRIHTDLHDEDGVVLYDDYGSSVLVPDEFTCDICQADWPISARWHALSKRPSTGEMTEVMWVCGDCGPPSFTRHTKECTHE